MNMEFKNILTLAAHTDDVEIGCGATLYKIKESDDVNIKVIAFSLAPGDGIEEEFKESMGILDVTYDLHYMDIRYLNDFRQDILDILYRESMENSYDVVFCPSSFDTHQDHVVVHDECFRAFKKTTILGYEMPWNNRSFDSDLFVEVNENHLDKKVEHFKCYKSQVNRQFFTKEYIYSVAKYRGYQAGKEYAEAFEVIRMIM